MTAFWKEALKKHGHYTLVGVASLAVPMLYGFPHSGTPLQRYQEEWITHTAGRPDFIDMDILSMTEKMKKKLKWHTKAARYTGDKLEWFPSRSLDISNRGTMQSIWGGLIGVPLFYSPKFIKNAEENPEVLTKYNINIHTEVGLRMFQLLKLNENSQCYSLAKEMVQTKSAVLYINALGMSSSIFGCYVFSVSMSALLPFRGSMFLAYILSVPVMTFLYYKFFDWQNRWAEKRVITRVAELDTETANGGLDYYDSLIEREKLINSGDFDSTVVPEFEPRKRPLCDFVLKSLDYFNFDKWFIDYRIPSLTNEERKQLVSSVIEKNFAQK